MFAIKFYCKKDRKSEHKYSKTINKGDLGNIWNSCLAVIPDILQRYPAASFAFTGASSVDFNVRKREWKAPTQRYRIYKYIVSTVIGQETFEHIQYDHVSSYLLINKASGDIIEQEKLFIKTFSETYLYLDDLQ